MLTDTERVYLENVFAYQPASLISMIRLRDIPAVVIYYQVVIH
jgi:hypothetical protein